jgi:hypothetical protein
MRPRLSSFELDWTDAAFDAIYPAPPRSMLPHGIASMHPARFFDDVLARIPLEQSLGLRATLWMIALAPLFTIRRLGTIASIGEDDRGRVLERLVTSRYYFVRQLAMSFKAIATLLYVQSDPVRAAMSVPVGPVGGSPAAVPKEERGSNDLVSASRLTSRAKSSRKTGKEGSEHDHAA